MSTHNINNQPLPKPLRTQLENTVKAAREVAEKGASAALAQMAVAEAKAPDYLSDESRALRRRLRAHGRALGDVKAGDDTQGVQHLVWEVAYEHWHRMLFARFLAENGLLLWEPGAAVSLDDCEALVQETDPAMNLSAKTKWELAGKLAARMLPQVFRPQSPVFELAFAPEHQRELERLLAALPLEVFKASDSLGWVYQFWQAKRKDEVNASEVKIGADELPALTQLFTEPYMVDFLLHNSLGAWWVTRHPGKSCPVPLTYLRTLDDGTPAAGKFEGWPDRLQDFKLLDPCCGSGHFLVAAFLMLVPMRMADEGLSAQAAVDAVLAGNLHGLELDARCVEIAVFALALVAWRFPDENGDPLGVRADMPAPQVACCGLKVASKPEDWMALVPDDASNAAYLQQELRLLHASFAQAPVLGSLLDPARSLKNDLATSSFHTLRGLLERALSTERPTTLWGQAGEIQDDTWDLALTARGLLDAARLLDARYHLVVTNVPYLARGRQCDPLKGYCETNYAEAKNDLANVFLERCLELARESKGGHAEGVVQIVMPQNWLFLKSYKKQRESLLLRVQWNLLARLGPGAFETISGEVVQAVLLTQTRAKAIEGFLLRGVDASAPRTSKEKADLLQHGSLVELSQLGQLDNPNSRVSLDALKADSPLEMFAVVSEGLHTGDYPRFGRKYWELPALDSGWALQQGGAAPGEYFSGMEHILYWQNGAGQLIDFVRERLGTDAVSAWIKGEEVWGKPGIAVNAVGDLRASYYSGALFTHGIYAVVPSSTDVAPPISAFATDVSFCAEVRKLDKKVAVARDSIAKVNFDLAAWQQVSAERYPDGLPKPYSEDPTQWLFHGHPQRATSPLEVAVARLAGYCWPAEIDTSMELAAEARAWIGRCAYLVEHTDDDGIVCLPSVRGEPPAHERLLKLLIAAWETVQPGSWKPSVLDKLLADADCAGKSLVVWLRDKFFEQHARRFHHRPFIWHVWDGLKDGFSALVNYHKLDSKNLERLIHTYLGDWIRQQDSGVRDGVDGAQTRLAAAQDLKRRLELILEGEPPYDIFVRWKKLSEQPIGWNPDLNDGVRLNIRPFVTAEVLRHNKKPKLNVSWDKDRGKDVESAPWFQVFKGERINDHHLTVAEKRAARGGK
ncbi:restriction endonuclease subunit M [Burkholderia multivorans]|uniref:DNA methyltransferase n=1 Tax=Burkholderia cepacia complex TaxID=87882 RepID=UPI00075E3EA0|nr:MULTISPECIES: DNA methyltransferase [Burkholderia cepacia complex]KVF14386.1 restriction endonuclease subunit M [Burkholderia vietnamiensis]PRG61220.1 restriction endonuclease subunit M [Burkholderia multivorans]